MYNLYYFYLNPKTLVLGAKEVKANIELNECLNHDLPNEVQIDPTFRGLFMRLINPQSNNEHYSQIVIQKRFNSPDRVPFNL